MKNYSELRFLYDSLSPGVVDMQIILMCKNNKLDSVDLKTILQQYKSAKFTGDNRSLKVLENVLNNIDKDILLELED